MKNKFFSVGAAIMLLVISGTSFSQDKAVATVALKPALLVIDIQNAFLPMIPEKEKEMAMANINSYIDLFRSNNLPVIRIYHSSKEYGVLPGTDQFEFPASVLIKPEDSRIIKTYPDGFNKTDLNKILMEKGSNTLFLCGLSAVGCVLATWFGSFNYDYKAFMLKDAIMSHNEEYTKNIEIMFDAVGYDVVKLIIENSAK